MAAYYYLASSLPMLQLENEPPLTTEEFMSACGNWVSKSELATLERLGLVPSPELAAAGGMAEKWNDWETALRDQLVRTRAGRSADAIDKYVREGCDWYSEIERGIQEAFSRPNPLAREQAIDSLRWKQLDDLETGHQFDIDFLSIYKVKLMLMEKRAGRDAGRGRENLEKIVDEIYQTPEEFQIPADSE